MYDYVCINIYIYVCRQQNDEGCVMGEMMINLKLGSNQFSDKPIGESPYQIKHKHRTILGCPIQETQLLT